MYRAWEKFVEFYTASGRRGQVKKTPSMSKTVSHFRRCAQYPSVAKMMKIFQESGFADIELKVHYNYD